MEEKELRNKQIVPKNNGKKEPEIVPVMLRNEKQGCSFSFEGNGSALVVGGCDATEVVTLMNYLLYFPAVKKMLEFEED